MSIQQIKVRARITIGNSLTAETPFILSFNVNKVRGQLSTFDASLKIPGTNITRSISGDNVKIYAGTEGSYNNNIIFSGIVKSIKITPCWDDPLYVYMNISGEDVLSTLRGKKYTRRSTASTAAWYSIEGVSRKGLRSGKFKAQTVNKVDTFHADTQKEGPTQATALPDVRNTAQLAKEVGIPASCVPAHSVSS